MIVTLQPEEYSASPVSVSVPMSQDEERNLMKLVGAAQIAQALKSIWDAFTRKR
ncbi:hypothetical protein ES703_24097 [subsurface metagenome]